MVFITLIFSQNKNNIMTSKPRVAPRAIEKFDHSVVGK